MTARRLRIVDAARDLFVRVGYDGTSVGDVADALGVTKSAITYYFPAKEDLLVAVADPHLVNLEQLLDRYADMKWPEELRDLVVAYLDALLVDRSRAIWLDTDPAVRRFAPAADRLDRARHRLQRLVTGGHEDLRLRTQALAMIGGLWRPIRMLNDATLDQVKDEIVDAAIASIDPSLLSGR